MCSHLSCYQHKTDCHKYRLLCVSLIVTIKQKSIVDTKKMTKKESKNNTKESHLTTKRARKRE